MCEPVTIISLGLAAASTAAGLVTQQQAINQQKDIYKVNKGLADDNALSGYAALARRQIEENAAASTAINENSLRAEAARSTARVSAAEAGVGGAGLQGLLDEFRQQEAAYQQSVVRRKTFADIQIEEEKKGVRAGQQAQTLASLPGADRPDYLGAALRLGSSVTQLGIDTSTFDKSTGKRAYFDV